jgi:hypothetical protein
MANLCAPLPARVALFPNSWHLLLFSDLPNSSDPAAGFFGISFYSPISQILLIPQQVFFSCYSPSDLPISSLIPRSISSVISSSFF